MHPCLRRGPAIDLTVTRQPTFLVTDVLASEAVFSSFGVLSSRKIITESCTVLLQASEPMGYNVRAVAPGESAYGIV